MMEKIDWSKRGFFSRFTNTTSQLTKHKVERTPRLAARPPRAIDEALFIRTCNGCGDCQSACSASVIEIKNGLAQVNIDYNDCVLCDSCTTACTLGALSSIELLQTDFRPQFLNDCQNYLSQHCHLCQGACPKQAISITEAELPILDISKCNGCGLCRKACHFESIMLKPRCAANG